MSSESVVRCGHCSGTGTCKNGGNGGSCNSCLSREVVFKTTWNGEPKTVKCSICKGTGYIKSSDI